MCHFWCPSSLPQRETRTHPSVCGKELVGSGLPTPRVRRASGDHGKGKERENASPEMPPPSPESTHSETARVRASTRWGFRVCACAPSHRHSGNVGHPNTGVTLGWACGATWRAQGSTNGIPSFPPGVATETNTARPRHATNFPPVSTGRYRGVGRVGRCNVHMLRVDRAYPFGHREVGVGGDRRCDHPLYPS